MYIDYTEKETDRRKQMIITVTTLMPKLRTESSPTDQK